MVESDSRVTVRIGEMNIVAKSTAATWLWVFYRRLVSAAIRMLPLPRRRGTDWSKSALKICAAAGRYGIKRKSVKKSRSRPIFIACPALRRVVRGSCAADSAGKCLCAPDGSFPLGAVSCNQDNGRCGETLCALHRYNRRGHGTWYPDRVWTLPSPSNAPSRGQNAAKSHEGTICIDA